MSYMDNIKDYHLDILKEVGNIGAGHAATALSNLLNKHIDMQVPSVNVVSFQEISETLGGEDSVVAGIFLRVEGDAPGNMFFMLPVTEATTLVQQLTSDKSIDLASPPFPEMGLSALNEVGNILAGAYLSALADFTSLNMQPTPPDIAIDMSIAILSHGLIEISKTGDYAIVINTEIEEKDERNFTNTTGHFFLLPDPESFEKIFESLGVHVDEQRNSK
ncbi:chemotaxis protein CheC [Bacillus shivajii]|uniref:chemotaxis protein CheC n=1 Tax=Bacillus shivajii TaxID=1983719 RepID=UPI001CFBB7EC|nr:chemotaxis protein CheC [Bacillus shivajii]UCZ51704.1 chemotaxis protein CheC [Bacillus shivajii]